MILSENHSRTFIDSAEAPEVHLVGAVEDDDVLAEATAHVLDGLCFTCTGRSSGGATHRHTQRLRQRDVTSTEIGKYGFMP